MKEEFLRLIYTKLKPKFTNKENPLWGQFYDDEVTGFECFKQHANDDQIIRDMKDDNTEFYRGIEDLSRRMADRISYQINRLYSISNQNK
jgi:hypothetical protein